MAVIRIQPEPRPVGKITRVEALGGGGMWGPVITRPDGGGRWVIVKLVNFEGRTVATNGSDDGVWINRNQLVELREGIGALLDEMDESSFTAVVDTD